MPGINWLGVVPHVVVGALVGLIAFIPLALVLKPQLKGENEGNMLLGILAVGASMVMLAAGVVGARLADGEIIPFASGEVLGFLAALGLIVAALAVREGR